MKLEGKNAVLEALNSNTTIDKVLILNTNRDDFTSKITEKCKAKGIRFKFVNKQQLDKETETKHHQGFIAYTSEFKYVEVEDILNEDIKLGRSHFIVILDGIEDPHNLGSIIRTAECAGVSGIIIPKNRACQVNETVIRTSAGATSHMKVARVTNINNTIKMLKEQNIFVYAMEAGGTNIYKANLKGNIAIVVGSEGFGVSKLTKSLSDQIISLPMQGKLNSLNASVAGALGIYEALKQRKF